MSDRNAHFPEDEVLAPIEAEYNITTNPARRCACVRPSFPFDREIGKKLTTYLLKNLPLDRPIGHFSRACAGAFSSLSTQPAAAAHAGFRRLAVCTCVRRKVILGRGQVIAGFCSHGDRDGT